MSENQIQKRSGHREYTPGCLWCEATEDALDLVSSREIGTTAVRGPALQTVRRMILSITSTCGNPSVREQLARAV